MDLRAQTPVYSISILPDDDDEEEVGLPRQQPAVEREETAPVASGIVSKPMPNGTGRRVEMNQLQWYLTIFG